MTDTRPNPLGEVASKVGVAWAAAGGVVSALATFGVLSSVQASAIQAAGEAAPGTITAVGTVIAGILPLVTGIVSAFRTASAGKEKVTPVSDPRADDGTRLVRSDSVVTRSDRL